jgi:hypothetical protein
MMICSVVNQEELYCTCPASGVASREHMPLAAANQVSPQIQLLCLRAWKLIIVEGGCLREIGPTDTHSIHNGTHVHYACSF